MVQGPVVDRTVWIAVVPTEHRSGFGREALFEMGEAGGPACIGFVEIDHEGPAALSGDGTIFLEILAMGIKEIRVRLEFLADGIALTLQRLAKSRVDIGKTANLCINFAYERVRMVQVTSLAGPEIIITVRIGYVGRAPFFVDHGDQLAAFVGTKEIFENAQFDFLARKTLHFPQSDQIVSRCIIGLCHMNVQNCA